MISHTRKCIFIHVPKCGGTSVEEYLRQHAGALGHLPEPGLDVALRRKGLAEILNRHRDYFTFTFVRDPFDRFISTWKHGLRGRGPYHERPVRDLSLNEYARIALEGRTKEQSAFDRYHLLPQVAFVPRPTQRKLFGVELQPPVSCSFTGRFERLEDDFRSVCQHLGIFAGRLPHLRGSSEDPRVPRSHQLVHDDPSTVRILEELYHEDFLAFGYAKFLGRNESATCHHP